LYYLGVDGGGTKTAAVLFDTDSGSVRLLSLAGGNICVLGKSGCEKLLEEITSRLLSDLSPVEVACSTFGFAGTGRPAERALVESVIAKLGFQNFSVKTDAEILHYSFFGDTSGILIASGTGSVCLVNTPDGHYHQIGGWGFILGDEGSGFHIGKLAISHALNVLDTGRERTALTQALLRFYHVNNPTELVTQTYFSTSPQRFVASCSRLVDELAGGDDPDAQEVIDCACRGLVELAKTAMKWCVNPGTEKFNFALAGGVLNGDSVIRRTFKRMIGASKETIEYFTQQYTPAAAAVLYSAAQCNYHISENDRRTLSNINFIASDSPDSEPLK